MLGAGTRNWRRTRSSGQGAALSLMVSLHRLAPDDALGPHLAHQAGYRAARNLGSVPEHLSPDLPHDVDAEILLEHLADLQAKGGIALLTHWRPLRITTTDCMLVVGRWGRSAEPGSSALIRFAGQARGPLCARR